MKKLYTIGLALLGSAMLAQTPFFNSVSYKGAFPVTDGMTGMGSNDWTAGWTNWDPENMVYPTVDSVINADITTNRTLSPSHTYQIVGNVSVKNGALLTILPGTVIRGDLATKSSLIIARGSMINATGTAAMPIVFTSNEAVGNRGSGDWGGLIVLGAGVINTACGTCTTSPNTNFIEGFVSTFPEIEYGGNNNADNSGVLQYVRVEFAGVALSATPNSEINGLTMGGVGSGTTIDHIQVSFSGDDSYEWFGGAVNASHLVAFRGLDDDFDTDFGFGGSIQFGLIVRDADVSDAAGDSNSFESDNFNPGTGRTPVTNAVFSNITIVGPKRDGSVSLPAPNYYGKAFRLRRNTAVSVFNSIVVGWGRGLSVEGSDTYNNYSATAVDSMAVFGANVLVGASPAIVTASGSASQSFYAAFWTVFQNDSTQTAAQVSWVNAFPTNLSDVADFRLQNASTSSTGASFIHPRFNGLVVGVKEAVAKTVDFSVYPNPASNNVSINLEVAKEETVSILVSDITGRVVATVYTNESLTAGNHVVNLNTTSFNSGMYFVTVKGGNYVNTQKLVINK